MLFAIVLLLTIGCIAFVLAREAKRTSRPDGLRGRIRDRGWGLLLLPVAMSAALMAGGAHGLIPAELGLAALAILFAPKLAAKLVPYGVLALAVFGVHLDNTYRHGNTSGVQYVFVHAVSHGATELVLAEAALLFVTGLWLLLRLDSPGAGPVRALTARWLHSGRRGIAGAQALFLIDGAEPGELEGYERCLVLFDGKDEDQLALARRQWSALKGGGAALSYWKQGARGGWERQA